MKAFEKTSIIKFPRAVDRNEWSRLKMSVYCSELIKPDDAGSNNNDNNDEYCKDNEGGVMAGTNRHRQIKCVL